MRTLALLFTLMIFVAASGQDLPIEFTTDYYHSGQCQLSSEITECSQLIIKFTVKELSIKYVDNGKILILTQSQLCGSEHKKVV